MDIKELRRAGMSIRQIARDTGHSRNTVAKLLSHPAPQRFTTPTRPSRLDPFKPHLTERYTAYKLSAVRLLDEIRPMGFCGSVHTVRRFIKTLAEQEHAAARATVRFETPPGAQAQADWADCGRLPSGARVYAFVTVLGYSRACYIEFTTSMAIPTLLRCHMNAFEYFGGIPKAILYDNMKQVRIDRFRYNAQLLDFAGHYGFAVKTHRPYRPRTKGKVERLVDYVKDSFVLGRAFADLADMNAKGRHWLDSTANTRIHATTQQRPFDLLEADRAALTPVRSVRTYQVCELTERKVDAEGFVRADGSRYSVPPSFVGKRIVVCVAERKITIRCKDASGNAQSGLIIAEHERSAQPGASIADKDHIAQLWRATLERATKQVGSSPAPDDRDRRLARQARTPGWDAPVEAALLTRYEEASAL